MLCGWFAEKAGRIGEMAARWGVKALEAPQAQNPGSRPRIAGFTENTLREPRAYNCSQLPRPQLWGAWGTAYEILY